MQSVYSQTKQLKRPKSTVGLTNVDNFVRESFDIYDKVYKYDGYAQAGTPLDDDDIDTLEEALEDLDVLSASAPDILSDIDGASVLKQGKATLQINKAKKALKYSIKTAKELLLGQRKGEEQEQEQEEETNTNSENNTTKQPQNQNTKSTTTSIKPESTTTSTKPESTNASDNLEIYSKFDFVPGDELIYFDDFSQDFIGDFPSKWNTNGSGEVVKLSKANGKWFEFKSGYGIYFMPLIDNKLPEEYTIEFDLFTEGLSNNTSSTAKLNIIFDDNQGFSYGNNYAKAAIPFGQYSAFGIDVDNNNGSNQRINVTVTADLRNKVLNNPHISIAVNKKRFRLWVNQTKYIDIPQLIYNTNIAFLKFELRGTAEGEEHIFISNLKIAEGGIDLRRQLMAEGKVSTNGILFDSGLATIKPQSFGIIRQISQVLNQDQNIKLNIIGHTDTDGSNDSNLKLSKARAEAVKNALVNVYKISENRLSTQGKGETEPVADNNTANGKAKNRRVEFVKI
ncbi:OmpA family protein [Seonamhaeicola algicola]|nr:OmpA family protein [Seonamhaeicola algicola]